MKKIPCSYDGCSNRRIHHERPDEMRPHRMIEVPDDFEGNAYCSIECQMYDKPHYDPVNDVFTKHPTEPPTGTTEAACHAIEYMERASVSDVYKVFPKKLEYFTELPSKVDLTNE
jgi:hypothetical protein